MGKLEPFICSFCFQYPPSLRKAYMTEPGKPKKAVYVCPACETYMAVNRTIITPKPIPEEA